MNDPWATPPAERPSWLTDAIEAELKAANFPIDQSGMLMLHADTKKRLDEYKEMEMEFRKVCAAFLVPEPLKNEGMNTVELGNGYQAKVEIKMNYSLADNDTVENGLTRIASVGNSGSFIAERLVNWHPTFSVSEYRKLQDDADAGDGSAKEILKIVNDFLTIKQGAPTLEIKPPKKGK